MRIRTTTFLVAAAALAVVTATVPTAAQERLRRIVVFGTSLSDPGNAFALRGGTNTPPDYMLDPLLVPSAPYARGGHHFSNGATWIEQFAGPRGLAGSVRPAFRGSDSNATNFAVGAARAREDGVNVNLRAQVDAFLREFSGRAPADALYTIEMGGNDIRDALAAYASRRDGAPIIQEAVLAISRNIQELHRAGAREFLVWRAPNVGLTPAIRTLERLFPGATQLATQITQAFNAGLDGAVAQLAGLPDIRIVRLDAYALLNDLVTYPSAFGLANVTTACVTPNVPPFTCERPDEFLFWDGIHPTTVAHTLIAQEAASVLRR